MQFFLGNAREGEGVLPGTQRKDSRAIGRHNEYGHGDLLSSGIVMGSCLAKELHVDNGEKLHINNALITLNGSDRIGGSGGGCWLGFGRVLLE